jgi:hypothetical protein
LTKYVHSPYHFSHPIPYPRVTKESRTVKIAVIFVQFFSGTHAKRLLCPLHTDAYSHLLDPCLCILYYSAWRYSVHGYRLCPLPPLLFSICLPMHTSLLYQAHRLIKLTDYSSNCVKMSKQKRIVDPKVHLE